MASPAGWREHRGEWLRLLVDLVYGGMPPAPDRVEVGTRSQGRVWRLVGEPLLSVYRVRVHVGGGALDLGLQVLAPRPDASLAGTAAAPSRSAAPHRRVPVVIDPDACWWNLSAASAERFLDNGVALARFDRTEVVADPGETPGSRPPRSGGLYDLHPGAEFGALAAWAWGIQRVVDALWLLAAGEAAGEAVGEAVAEPVGGGACAARLDTSRIAVTGFSRGGKAALVAGATDERIGLVHAHASGAGGAAPFLVAGAGSEGMRVVERFPGWFGPRLAAYVGREGDLPVDQHALLAAVSPRPLLLTCGADDAWANPEGTAEAALAAREVAALLGEPGAVEFQTRPDGHYRGPEDWSALLDFVTRHWFGAAPRAQRRAG